MKTTSFTAITILAIASTSLAQGPLTPPPGADPSIGPVNALTAGGLPQATMKTLHQVEPRTAIAGGTSGVTISQSGSYYLTADITVADGMGVEISASSVTLDLNGFSIVSTNASPDASDVGVGLQTYIKNITIRNGTICGGGAGGKFYAAIGHTGFTSSTNVSVVDVTVSDTTHWGIALDPSANSRVERCFVKTEGVTGAIQAGLVADCSATGGSVYAGIVRDSSVNGGRIIGNVVKGSFASGGITTSVADNPGTAIPPSPAVPVAGPHYTISQPGSYYLTGSIQVASGHGIEITASNVTLDLKGFALISTAVTPASGNAINFAAWVSNIEIRNGHISGGAFRTYTGPQSWNATFADAGWYSGIGDGFYTRVTGLLLSNLTIERCKYGVYLNGRGAGLDHITANSNAIGGIRALGGTIFKCTAHENGGIGIDAGGGSVTNCTVISNSGYGINAQEGSVTSSNATSNGYVGINASDSSVTNCTANYNGDDGIRASAGSVTNSQASSNFKSGIEVGVGVVAHCAASYNSTDPATVDLQIQVSVGGQRIGNVPAAE